MMFREVKTAIAELLQAQAAGRFRVVGRQVQSKASDELQGNDRLVQVYFSEGQFPRNAARMRGPKTFDITIDIDMSASAAATGDVTVLESNTATHQQKAVAIAALRDASDVADQKIDEMVDAVYQIMMDARNESIGFPTGEIASRWIERIQKDTLLERGDLVVKTASMKYTCRIQEIVSGSIGNEPDTVIIDSETPVDGGSSTGALVENDNT